MTSDAWTTVVNLREPSNRWAGGAKAYVLQIPGDGVNCQLLVRSRSGRWIRAWVRINHIRNPRVKWAPPQFRDRICAYDNSEWAQIGADRLTSILGKESESK